MANNAGNNSNNRGSASMDEEQRDIASKKGTKSQDNNEKGSGNFANDRQKTSEASTADDDDMSM